MQNQIWPLDGVKITHCTFKVKNTEQQVYPVLQGKTFNFFSTESRYGDYNENSLIGFLQLLPPLHLQYLQQWIPATQQGQPFLCAHLPHEQGSGKPSGFEITISGLINSPLLQNHKHLHLRSRCVCKWCLDPKLLLIIGSCMVFSH